MARLELRGVDKTFAGGIVAARGVDLTVEDGELFVIVGPSGSGKSTSLRLVAGLERLDAGSIHLDGRRIDGLPPAERDVAMVFQDQVLYPHLDVFENMAFGLRARRVGRREVDGRVRETASALGLAECLDRPPGTLSGGQRRRVALGRAMVLRPRLFLLDEPFSGLDAPLRASTRSELAELHRKTGATIILVTHDQGEALALGDRVAVIDRGRVVQVGRPLDLYDRPCNRFVARFLGQPPINILGCEVAMVGQGTTVRIVDLDGVGPSIPPEGPPAFQALAGRGVSRVEMGFRPEQVSIRNSGGPDPSPTAWSVPATIRRLEPMGHETLAYLGLGPYELAARLPPTAAVRVGESVLIDLDPSRASWFDPVTGDRLG